MIYGTYAGDVAWLKGHKAIIRDECTLKDHVLVQFQSLVLPHSHTHGWVPVLKSDMVFDK